MRRPVKMGVLDLPGDVGRDLVVEGVNHVLDDEVLVLGDVELHDVVCPHSS